MQLQAHTLKSACGTRRAGKRIGRGNASGHGTSSCRGGKGQTARSGGSRGIQRRSFKFVMQATPKLRGFHSMNTRPAEVRLSDMEREYKDGETVDLNTLKQKKLVRLNVKMAKILDKGELKKKLIVIGVKATKSAAEKIISAGGEVK